MNSGIYKITSPTYKIYIGQSKDLKRRKSEYKNNDVKLKAQRRLYNSLQKYGIEHHQFDIIEYCSEEELNCSERFWQDEFDVIGKDGLNCILQDCGVERRVFSEDTRQKMSERTSGKNNPMFGVIRPKEWGENHSVFLKDMFSNPDYVNPLKGRKMPDRQRKILMDVNLGRKSSDDTKKKMSDSGKGKVMDEEWRKNISNGKLGEKNPMFGKYGELNKNSKIIINTLTGELTYGVAELSRLTNISRSVLKDQLNGYRTNHTPFMFLDVVNNFENYFEIGKEVVLSNIFTKEELEFIKNSTLTEKIKRGSAFYNRFIKYCKHNFKNM